MNTEHEPQPSDLLPAEPYRYETRLQGRNIRLLQIEPGKNDSIIQCRLLTKPLDEDVLYHALSYTWGDPKGVQPIHCEGKVLRVTQNLHEALTEYRRRGETTLLWADAVCINQSDVTEKTGQVRMMRDVYVQADTVIIWLGQAPADIQVGLDLIFKLNELFSDDSDEQFERHIDLDLRKVGLPVIGSNDWSALASLLSRPWFSRMWIIQEFLSASRPIFWCGSVAIASRSLLNAAFATMLNHTLNIAYRARITRRSATQYYCANILCGSKYYGSTYTETIIGVAALKHFEASDYRDRIFALVGLVQDIDESFIDYSKTVRQVLIEIAKHCLAVDTDGSLDLLSYATLSSQPERLPSWVPSWTSDVDYSPLVLTHGSRHFPTSHKPVLVFGTDDKLDVQGKRIDTIKKVADALLSYHAPDDALHGCWVQPDWEKQCRHLADELQIYPNGQDIREAYWRTLIRNTALSDSLAPLTAPPEFARDFEVWQLFLGEWAGLKEEFEASQESAAGEFDRSAVMKFYEHDEQRPRRERMMEYGESTSRLTVALALHVAGSQFCITKQGYMGWIPISGQVGDQVCILYGCRIPYLIRPEGSGFRLLGDVYLHGLMDGEAIELKHAEPEMIQLV